MKSSTELRWSQAGSIVRAWRDGGGNRTRAGGRRRPTSRNCSALWPRPAGRCSIQPVPSSVPSIHSRSLPRPNGCCSVSYLSRGATAGSPENSSANCPAGPTRPGRSWHWASSPTTIERVTRARSTLGGCARSRPSERARRPTPIGSCTRPDPAPASTLTCSWNSFRSSDGSNPFRRSSRPREPRHGTRSSISPRRSIPRCSSGSERFSPRPSPPSTKPRPRPSRRRRMN